MVLRYVFGMVLCVACSSPAQQLKRLQKRNPDLTPVECQKRIDSQLPMSVKTWRADIVLWNDRDIPSISSPIKTKKKSTTTTSTTTKEDEEKEEEEDSTKEQQYLEEQVQKALQVLDDRMYGLMGLSLSQLVLMMVGTLMVSTGYKLYQEQQP